MTAGIPKKKTSRLAMATLVIGISTWCAGIAYLGAYQKYWDSLRTNSIAGNLMEIFGTAWFFLSIITFFAFLSSIARIAWSKSKLRGFIESICALIAVFVTASLVMPTLGLMNSIKYKQQASRIAWEYLEEYKTTQTDKSNIQALSLANYDVEIKDDYNISEDEPKVIEVVYTLKEDTEMLSCPQQFSVLLNFDTGEKTIKEEGSSEE